MFDQRRSDKIGEGKRNLRYVLIQNAAKNAARRRLRDFARHKLCAYVFGGGFLGNQGEINDGRISSNPDKERRKNH